jgi:penicillin-binding protein 1A
MMTDKAPANKRLRPGAVVRVIKDDKGVWQLSQLPEVQAGFVAMSPTDGAVLALVGGFDYTLNKYNHITQAWRQPGSSFKPFIYSAALEKGFTPASIVEDSPITIGSAETGSSAWTPKNYDGKYEGPMRLRTALAKSKNMVSIRILQASGVKYAQEYVARFGFDAEKHPPYLTMALGAGSVTPWQMARAYTVFANGGYLVNPYIVQEIRDEKGAVLAQAQPVIAGDTAPRVIEARNAFVMDSMLRDVTIYGTAAKASAQLKRTDLAGKTGTTNEHVDAWFCGYQLTIAGCAWMGFDQPRNLGNGETGGQAALPIWIGTMETALQGVPQGTQPAPEGVVSVDVASTRRGGTAKEFFFKDNVPASIEPEPADSGAKPVD